MTEKDNAGAREAERRAELKRARALIEQGAGQLDRGQVVDGETFFREWDEELRRAGDDDCAPRIGDRAPAR